MKKLGSWVRGDVPPDAESHIASGAAVDRGDASVQADHRINKLQDRLTLRFSTACAKPMNWLVVVNNWLVDKSEGTNIYLLKLILLGLSVPCRHACYFLFKLSFALVTRQIVRLCSRYDHGGGPKNANYAVEFGLDRLAPSKTKERLDQVTRSVQMFKEFFETATVVEHQKILSLEAELRALRERQAARLGHSNTGAMERVLAETEE